MEIKLKSPAFEEGGMIPSRCAGDGFDVSPALEWESVPEDCKTLAIICDAEKSSE